MALVSLEEAVTSPTNDRLRRSFDYEADVASIAMARRDVSEFVIERFRLAEAGPAEAVDWFIERLRLVVSELCSNAVEAAPRHRFGVEIAIDDAGDIGGPEDPRTRRPVGVTCSVTNRRSGDPTSTEVRFGVTPDMLAEGGRGLVIVDALADRAWAEHTAEATVVTAQLRLIADH